jgi:hypothetical protein
MKIGGHHDRCLGETLRPRTRLFEELRVFSVTGPDPPDHHPRGLARCRWERVKRNRNSHSSEIEPRGRSPQARDVTRIVPDQNPNPNLWNL